MLFRLIFWHRLSRLGWECPSQAGTREKGRSYALFWAFELMESAQCLRSLNSALNRISTARGGRHVSN